MNDKETAIQIIVGIMSAFEISIKNLEDYGKEKKKWTFILLIREKIR